MNEPITVVIVDDQELVCSGFAMIINLQPDMQVVGTAHNGIEALQTIRNANPDVVLMDIRMPQMDGIEATRTITQQHEHCHVIILTTFDLDEYVMGAIHAGASGFLLKNSEPEQLLSAIRTVYNGDAIIAPSATKRLIEQLYRTIQTQNSVSLAAINVLPNPLDIASHHNDHAQTHAMQPSEVDSPTHGDAHTSNTITEDTNLFEQRYAGTTPSLYEANVMRIREELPQQYNADNPATFNSTMQMTEKSAFESKYNRAFTTENFVELNDDNAPSNEIIDHSQSENWQQNAQEYRTAQQTAQQNSDNSNAGDNNNAIEHDEYYCDKELEKLTAREREILIAIAQGLSNQEIAEQYVISISTVKTHVAHILDKIHARDRIQAVIFAYENHLV